MIKSIGETGRVLLAGLNVGLGLLMGFDLDWLIVGAPIADIIQGT